MDDGDDIEDRQSSTPTNPADNQTARDLEFEMFYKSEMPKVVAFLMVQGGRAPTATEIAQEAMLEAYRQWDVIDQPRAWVRRVASRMWWRARETERAERPQDALPESGPLLTDDAAAEIEARHTFLAMTRQLPAAQREVMAWTYDGYRPTEIAALISKPPATVRSVLRQAREALRSQNPSVEEAP
ncbi:sigma-70 family RNA polymerase sigma factor [Virgisporangium ochraceum]|uniref:RNA polymerase sigma factor n=1 Tax=Virgisporangium ochraceum TaxID=65505 RepID=A0A8J3ZUY2_9ACTN|nr:sigma-70 family RNA polymerase sigma factor [Virgisporangium ochraceum]GIJ68925.1 RNA polymerase sigma factor [Virgisporangium ochraceum]